jgi:hypothetical protein
MVSRRNSSNSMVLGITLTWLASCQSSHGDTGSHAATSHYGPRTAGTFNPTLESVVLGAMAGHDAAPLQVKKGLLNGADLGWGLLYAPSIIDAWTTASDESTSLY